MNVTDTSHVLAKIQAFNNRTFDKPAIMAWHETIGDLELTDCLTAVTNFFMDSKEWIMPSDIRHGVSAIRKKRVESIKQDVRLREDDEELDDMRLSIAKHKHLMNLIMSGQFTAEQYAEYHAGQIDIPGLPKALTK